MPAKNSTLFNGPRDNILDKKFYNKVREKLKIDLPDDKIKAIIVASNLKIHEIIADEEGGFKIPENMGYMVVTKYKSKKRPIDWVNSKKLKKQVCLTNLHSFGYVHHIKWFRLGLTANFASYDVYKFEPCRDIKRRVAKNVKSYKVFHSWTNSDFFSNSKTLRRLINNNNVK
jgi:hypothetical protein